MMASLVNPSNGTGSKGRLDNTYRSQCKVCGFGIYTGQAAKFSRKPLGLCHVECLDGAQ
jgi:hypothetical protein